MTLCTPQVFLRLRKEFSTRGATGLVGLIRSFRSYDKRMVTPKVDRVVPRTQNVHFRIVRDNG